MTEVELETLPRTTLGYGDFLKCSYKIILKFCFHHEEITFKLMFRFLTLIIHFKCHLLLGQGLMLEMSALLYLFMVEI